MNTDTAGTMEHQDPTISVIVPVYNAEGTMKRCVDSILEQTYGAVELVLVDDGSTDGSPALVDAYAQSDPGRVRTIHKRNGGLMRAWMDGVSVASGSYLCFVDSDDWIDRDMIERMAGQLLRREGRFAPGQIVCCGWLFEYTDRPPKAPVWSLPEGIYEGAALDRELKPHLMGHEKRRIAYSRCEKLISRELVEQNLRFLDPRIRLGEDANITVPAMLDARRIVVMHDPFYHYLYGEGSMAHHYHPGFYDDILRLRAKLRLAAAEKQIQPQAVEDEFYFLFLQVLKSEIRRTDGRGAARRAIRRIQRICEEQDAARLAANCRDRATIPANRLMALLCRKPSPLRIRLVRMIFLLYERLR